MALSKLGDFIELVDNRNESNVFNASNVRGISTSKAFIDTKANLDNVSLQNYKVVNVGQFAYVADTSRRGEKIGLAYADSEPCIISSIYTVFKVKDEKKLLPRYLMMFFNRSEFDRYARFNSWGSARETFSWDDFCDIVLEIPSIEIQKKYVAIYEGLLANLHSYERGLDDLRLVCDGFLEDIKRRFESKPIGQFIELVDSRNFSGVYGENDVRGISTEKSFIDTKANLSNVSLLNYKVVENSDFAYVVDTSRRGEKIALAFQDGKSCIVSSIYSVFRVINESVLFPSYLMMFFKRSEFDRYARFNSWGSARENFLFEDMEQVRVPMPKNEVQRSIAEVFRSIDERTKILANLKEKISLICPVLVRGSIEESTGGSL